MRYGIESLGQYGMEWLDVIEFDGMGLSTVEDANSRIGMDRGWNEMGWLRVVWG